MNKYYKEVINILTKNGYIVSLQSNRNFEIMLKLDNNKISKRMFVDYSLIKKSKKDFVTEETLCYILQGSLLDSLLGGDENNN